MTCPHLAYLTESDEHTFDTERAFCTVIGEFVQPMRADICNDRYELDHRTDCEIYREHESDSGVDSDDGGDA